jgi:hypothetical protein
MLTAAGVNDVKERRGEERRGEEKRGVVGEEEKGKSRRRGGGKGKGGDFFDFSLLAVGRLRSVRSLI